MHIEPIEINTSRIADKNRDEMMRDYYGKIAMRMEVDPASSDHFYIDAKTFILPGVSVVNGVVTSMRARRTTEMRSDGNSDVILMFARNGMVLAHDSGEETYIQKGDALLTSLDRPIGFFTPERLSENVSIQLPRESLAPLVSNLDDRLSGSLSIGKTGAALLSHYAKSLFAVNRPRAHLASVAAKHIIELAALAIGADSDGREQIANGGVKAARLAAAKEFVMQTLANAGLDASLVAAHLGVSPRYLHMLFDSEGFTFNEFVVSQRLARAHRLLGDRSASHLKIGDIAGMAGFGDTSSFNRAFRRKFGMKPSDCRPR